MLAEAYDFPVALKELQTVDGTPVPRSRAVIRTDTGEAISTVSDRYKIITHGAVMEKIGPYMQELGTPERRLHVEGKGARFTAEYLFRDRQLDVGPNHVALRVIVRNAYKVGHSLQIQVATIVLECLNLGIITEKTVFDASVRHVGDNLNFTLPDPNELLTAFTSSQQVFQTYSEKKITLDDGLGFIDNEKVRSILPDATADSVTKLWCAGCDKGNNSVWDLLQHTTYEITHNSPRLSFTGRHSRLTRVARVFNTVFAGY
jgi:hypothetical protein